MQCCGPKLTQPAKADLLFHDEFKCCSQGHYSTGLSIWLAFSQLTCKVPQGELPADTSKQCCQAQGRCCPKDSPSLEVIYLSGAYKDSHSTACLSAAMHAPGLK